jgi:hypothetical protein
LYYFVVGSAEILRFSKEFFDWAIVGGGDAIFPLNLRQFFCVIKISLNFEKMTRISN